MEIEAQEEGENGLSSVSNKGIIETSHHTKNKGMTSKCNVRVQHPSPGNIHEELETPKVAFVVGNTRL
jgi:hypothetical protein